MNWPLLEKAKQDFLNRQSCGDERPRLTPRAHPYPKPSRFRSAEGANDQAVEQCQDGQRTDGSGFGPTGQVLHDFDLSLRRCHNESCRVLQDAARMLRECHRALDVPVVAQPLPSLSPECALPAMHCQGDRELGTTSMHKSDAGIATDQMRPTSSVVEANPFLSVAAPQPALAYHLDQGFALELGQVLDMTDPSLDISDAIPVDTVAPTRTVQSEQGHEPQSSSCSGECTSPPPAHDRVLVRGSCQFQRVPATAFVRLADEVRAALEAEEAEAGADAETDVETDAETDDAEIEAKAKARAEAKPMMSIKP